MISSIIDICTQYPLTLKGDHLLLDKNAIEFLNSLTPEQVTYINDYENRQLYKPTTAIITKRIKKLQSTYIESLLTTIEEED